MKLHVKAFLAVSLLTTSILLTPLGQDKAANNITTNTVPAMTTNNEISTEFIAPTYQDVLVAKVPVFDNKTKDLRLNIYKPQNVTVPTPVLVYIHGGGWSMGTYADPGTAPNNDATANTAAQPNFMRVLGPRPADNENANAQNDLMSSDNRSSLEVFKEVVRHGITLVSIDYRLNSEAYYPAQIYDVKGAIRFIRAHANEYGIDPNRIAVSGTSAGAHLAALLGTTNNNPGYEGTVGGNIQYSSAVSAVIDYYGPTDLLTMAPEMSTTLQSPEDAAEIHDSPRAMESVLLGFNKDDQGVALLRQLYQANDRQSPYWPYVELAIQGSPVHQVTPQTPPMFIAHGGRDTLVPIAQSHRLRDALTANGVENLFISNSEAPHGNQGQLVNETMIQWIVDKLNAPPTTQSNSTSKK